MKSSTNEPGAAPREFFMEHRWGCRVPCSLCVRLSAGAKVSGAGRLRDVSMSGAFIETALDLPQFAQVELAVVRDDPPREITMMASVVRVERDGIAVEWCEMSAGPICALLGCATRCAASATPLCKQSSGRDAEATPPSACSNRCLAMCS
jgi:hypothetical protein